mmetsp:Transcript_27436/g.51215  ORF Transcript_27436/g.51215 Transcript_27436/m.51215 type:complete len:105 (-) Transcript_27436:282-596(-)
MGQVDLWTDAHSENVLRPQLEGFALEEARGGTRYDCHPKDILESSEKKIGINDMQCSDDRIRTTTRRITHETTLSATETVKQVVQAGRVPLGKWQTHLFELLLE